MQQLATGLEPVMGQPAITRLEQMYVIAKLEQGQYVYYNQNTKKFLPTDNHASKWTSISAVSPYLLDEITAKISDICQLVWLTKNTSYENVGGIFLRKNTIDS